MKRVIEESYMVTVEVIIRTYVEQLEEHETDIDEIAEEIAHAIGDELANITHDAADVEVCCPHLSV